MDLNLPIFDQVAGCKNLLIAGMGGGFDVFCGVPIYLELQSRGQCVHLANFSFSELSMVRGGIHLSPTLIGVQGSQIDLLPYFPELYLARWFQQKREEEVTIWSFAKTGAGPLLENYRLLVEHLHIDGILLIDGGVDSLVRGDEVGTGTLIEDACSLYAVNELSDVPVRLLTCLGMGAEQDMAHAQILQNIAALTAAGGFHGSCALTPQMEVYQLYEEAVLYAQGQPVQDASVINSSIISAVQGHYGDYHLTEKTKGGRLWISPLMTLFWFFDLPTVARHNLYLPQLKDAESFMAALYAYRDAARSFSKRHPVSFPLS
jgi:hypothetical protein